MTSVRERSKPESTFSKSQMHQRRPGLWQYRSYGGGCPDVRYGRGWSAGVMLGPGRLVGARVAAGPRLMAYRTEPQRRRRTLDSRARDLRVLEQASR